MWMVLISVLLIFQWAVISVNPPITALSDKSPNSFHNPRWFDTNPSEIANVITGIKLGPCFFCALYNIFSPFKENSLVRMQHVVYSLPDCHKCSLSFKRCKPLKGCALSLCGSLGGAIRRRYPTCVGVLGPEVSHSPWPSCWLHYWAALFKKKKQLFKQSSWPPLARQCGCLPRKVIMCFQCQLLPH